MPRRRLRRCARSGRRRATLVGGAQGAAAAVAAVGPAPATAAPRHGRKSRSTLVVRTVAPVDQPPEGMVREGRERRLRQLGLYAAYVLCSVEVKEGVRIDP